MGDLLFATSSPPFLGYDLFLCYLLCLAEIQGQETKHFFGTKFVNIFIVCINNDLLFHSFLPEDIRPDVLASISLTQKNKPKAFEPEGKGPNTGHIQATYDPSSSSPS